jgi:hypothetical protein
MVIEANGLSYTISAYAGKQMLERGAELKHVVDALETAAPELSEAGTGHWIYQGFIKNRRISVVVSPDEELIVTVYYTKA